MIKSMTGFGKGESSDGKRNVVAEMKSVNHRYVDVHVKLPRRYSFLEEKIKKQVKETVKRGKIEISVQIENLTEEDMNINLNTLIAKQYMKNINELKEMFHMEEEISLQYLASLPDVIKSMPDIENEEEIEKLAAKAIANAINSFDKMRIIEGEKLAEDLMMRGELIRNYLTSIEERAPMVSKLYADRLSDHIQELIGKNIEIPTDRILVEAAVFADKSNITEEIVRLDSHIIQMGDIINNAKRSEGKKLDFLIQEMNRETNTIGSKANDIDITKHMLEIKSEVEKIREQVQNIE